MPYDDRQGCIPDRSRRWTALLTLYSLGDQAARDQFLVELGPWLLAGARRRLPNLADAEDVVQEAVLKVFLALDRFDLGRGNVCAWAARILAHEVANHFRRQRTPTWNGEQEPVTEGAGFEERVEAEEAAGRLNVALSNLPATEAEAIRLRFLNGHTLREVASVLGLSLGTAASRVYRALGRLRHGWGRAA